jgi:hypothetical protein
MIFLLYKMNIYIIKKIVQKKLSFFVYKAEVIFDQRDIYFWYSFFTDFGQFKYNDQFNNK